MSNTSRFTPLHVVRIFLDIMYYRNKNIIIQEAFLESNSEFEEYLCRDLKKIDEIANSDDQKQIIEFVKKCDLMMSRSNISQTYMQTMNVLFHFNCINTYCEDVESFLQCVKCPNIINHDAIKNFIPLNSYVMFGDHHWERILDCIFRYILYEKTKHLHIFEQVELNFRPGSDSPIDEMKDNFIFNYYVRDDGNFA